MTYEQSLAQYNQKIQDAIKTTSYDNPASMNELSKMTGVELGTIKNLAANNRLPELTQAGGFADVGGSYWNGQGESSYSRMQNRIGSFGGVDPSKGYTDMSGAKPGDPNFWKTHDSELARVNSIFSKAGVGTVDDPFAAVRAGKTTTVAAPALTAADIAANAAAPKGTDLIPSTASTTVIPGTTTALPQFSQQQLDAARAAGQPSGTVNAASLPQTTQPSYSIADNGKGGFDLKSSNGNVVFSGKSVEDVQNIIKGTGWTTPFSIATPSGTFDASKMGTGTTLNSTATGGAYTGTDTTSVAGASSLATSVSSDVQKLTTERDALEAALKSDAGKLVDEATRLDQEQKKQGLDVKLQQLADVRSKIEMKQAEYARLEQQNRERRPGENVSLGLMQGEEARLQRARATEVLMLSAEEQGLLGKIETSKDLAQKAIDLEFAPIKQRIKNAEMFLELNKDNLTKAEAKQAAQTKALLDIQKEAADNAQKEKEMALADTYKAMDKYRDAGISISDTPEQVQQKIVNSPTYQGELSKVDMASYGTGQIGEYNYYAATERAAGRKPMDFNSYQTMDANRKRSVSNTYITNAGGYTSTQEKAISEINDGINKTAPYLKTNNMLVSRNNVLNALANKNGISDISAINQFQKVIDDGAVTRDQDVKLIQGAQSLANTLKTKIAKLQKGDQLQQSQRDQMAGLVEQFYTAQLKELQTDPFVTALQKTAERRGIKAEDTILGGLQQRTGSSAAVQPSAADEAYIKSLNLKK